MYVSYWAYGNSIYGRPVHELPGIRNVCQIVTCFTSLVSGTLREAIECPSGIYRLP